MRSVWEERKIRMGFARHQLRQPYRNSHLEFKHRVRGLQPRSRSGTLIIWVVVAAIIAVCIIMGT